MPVGRVLSGSAMALVAAAVIALWPASLGGSTTLIVVSGASMESTYRHGDLVVVRSHPADVGDVAAFRVPDGTPGAGMLVIHRLVEEHDGRWISQGDNRDTRDPWWLTRDDLVGTPVAHLPRAGIWLAWAGSPVGLALFAGLVTAWLAWPSRDTPSSNAALTTAATDRGEGLPPTPVAGAGTLWTAQVPPAGR